FRSLAGAFVAIDPHHSMVVAVAGDIEKVGVELRGIEAVPALPGGADLRRSRGAGFPCARLRIVDAHPSALARTRNVADYDHAIVGAVVVGGGGVAAGEAARLGLVRRIGPGVGLDVVDVDAALVGTGRRGVRAAAHVDAVPLGIVADADIRAAGRR